MPSFFQPADAGGRKERTRSPNLGGPERALRIVAGLVILDLGLFGPLGRWGLVGLVPLATGLMRWRPAYAVLGVRTCAPGGGAA